MNKEQKSELKARINDAKKSDHNFGLCLGKTNDATVLLIHKTKAPESLGKQAQKEGETAKVAFGVVSCKSTTVTFRCVQDPPSGLASKMREYFKGAGLTLQVEIGVADGTTVGEDGVEETPEERPAEASTSPGGGKQESIRKAFDLLKPKLKVLIETVPDSRVVLQTLIKQVQQGDESEAAAALKKLASLAAAAATLGDERKTPQTNSVETELYKVFPQSELSAAWRACKEALQNPDDRNKVMGAREMNPILAKYALAYGAYAERDMVAIQALKACGADERMLASENAMVHKIVQYLEANYEEYEAPRSDNWHPGKIEISGNSFIAFYQTAMDKKKGVRLQQNRTFDLTLSKMLSFEESLKHPSFERRSIRTLEDFDAHVEQCRTVVVRADDLASRLTSFNPRDDEGQVCVGFESYLNYLVSDVRRKREQASKMASASPPKGLAPAESE